MYLNPIHRINYNEIEQQKNVTLNTLTKLGTKKQISRNEISENKQIELFGKEVIS